MRTDKIKTLHQSQKPGANGLNTGAGGSLCGPVVGQKQREEFFDVDFEARATTLLRPGFAVLFAYQRFPFVGATSRLIGQRVYQDFEEVGEAPEVPAWIVDYAGQSAAFHFHASE